MKNSLRNLSGRGSKINLKKWKTKEELFHLNLKELVFLIKANEATKTLKNYYEYNKTHIISL